MGNPRRRVLGGDWEGEEGGDADRRPVWEEKRDEGVKAARARRRAGGPGPWVLGARGLACGLASHRWSWRLLLSGTWWCSGPGKAGWDAGAGRVALPLRMSIPVGRCMITSRTSPAHTALPVSNSPGSRFLSLPGSGSLASPSGRARGQVTSFFGPQSLLCLELTPITSGAAPARLHALTLTRTRTLPHPLHTHATRLSHPCTPWLGHPEPPHSALTPTSSRNPHRHQRAHSPGGCGASP